MVKKRKLKPQPPSIIRKWLQREGTTQGELAARVGVTVNYLNQLINRKHKNVKIFLALRLAAETGIPLETLSKDMLLGYDPEHHEGAA